MDVPLEQHRDTQPWKTESEHLRYYYSIIGIGKYESECAYPNNQRDRIKY